MGATLRTALALGVLISACGGGGDGYRTPTIPNPNPPSTSNSISVRDNNFNPSATTVAVGTTVTWTWTGADVHNVTFPGGPASPDQSIGTYARTFSTAGAFNYSCTRHPGMSGSVTVQ